MQSRVSGRRHHTLPARLRDYSLDELEASAASPFATWSEGSTGRKRGRTDRGLMSLRELQAVFAEEQPEDPANVDTEDLADALFGNPSNAEVADCPSPSSSKRHMRRSPRQSPTEEIETLALLEALVNEESESFGEADDTVADEVSSLFQMMGAADDVQTPFELFATPDILLGVEAPLSAALPAPPILPEPIIDEMAHDGTFSDVVELPLPVKDSARSTPPVAAAEKPSATAASLGEKPSVSRNVAERKEWTAAEDELIRTSVQNHGCKWRVIASLLPGRSDDAVRNRWNRLLEAQSPRTTVTELGRDLSEGSTSSAKGGGIRRPRGSSVGADGEPAAKPERVSWSRQEDDTIVRSVGEFGHKWGKIAQRLPGRTEHAIRNRYSRLQSLVSEQAVMPPLPAPIAAC